MEWRDIPGYEGIYSVNDVGDIYSHYTNKILKPSISNDGYKQCVLYKNHQPSIMCNHKAAALAFIPREDRSLVVNHKDENKQNCSIDNLEWVTHAENNNYMGNRSMHAAFEKFAKDFYVYDKDLNLLGKHRGIKKYAREHNLNDGNICHVIKINKGLTSNFHSYKNVVYTDGPLAQAAEQGTHNT